MAAGCAALLRRATPDRRSAGRSRGIGATRARFRCHRARACLGSEVVEAKQALLSAAAGTSRGARASEQAAAAVLGAFERVEGLNACEAPADLPEMLDGWYSLLYQAPEDPSKASAATTTEGWGACGRCCAPWPSRRRSGSASTALAGAWTTWPSSSCFSAPLGDTSTCAARGTSGSNSFHVGGLVITRA